MRETLPGDLRRRTEAKITERVGFGLALVAVLAIHFALEWLGSSEVKASSNSRPAPSDEETPADVQLAPEHAAMRRR